MSTSIGRHLPGSLVIVDDGTVCTIVLHREDTIPFELDSGALMRAFECSIAEVREDRVTYSSIAGAGHREGAKRGVTDG